MLKCPVLGSAMSPSLPVNESTAIANGAQGGKLMRGLWQEWWNLPRSVYDGCCKKHCPSRSSVVVAAAGCRFLLLWVRPRLKPSATTVQHSVSSATAYCLNASTVVLKSSITKYRNGPVFFFSSTVYGNFLCNEKHPLLIFYR